MDRLTKDFAGVVIGDQSETDLRESREEQSRSTWAQVVSENAEDRRGEDHRDSEGGQENNDGWQPAHKKDPKHPKKSILFLDQIIKNVHMDRWDSYKLPPNNQEYAKDIDDSSNLEPFEDELLDLSRACNKLWELDFNRLVPGKDYEIDCGEEKKFYLEEAKGRVNYHGYISPRRRGEFYVLMNVMHACMQPDSETQLLIQFEWRGALKSASSSFIGVSPEFEMALYTLCFLVGGEDNDVELGPYRVNIKCYRHGNNIGSVFPIAQN
ncbi:hypothetical protein V2J09_020384 [Rumex salicifolius]